MKSRLIAVIAPLFLVLFGGSCAHAQHAPMEIVIAYGMFPVLGDNPFDKNSLDGKVVEMYRLINLGEPGLASQIYQSLPPAGGDVVAQDYALLAQEHLEHYSTSLIGGGRPSGSDWKTHAEQLDAALAQYYSDAATLSTQATGAVQFDISKANTFQGYCELFLDNTHSLEVSSSLDPMSHANPDQVNSSLRNIENFFQPLFNGGGSSLNAAQLSQIRLYLLARTFKSSGLLQQAADQITNGEQFAQNNGNVASLITWKLLQGDLAVAPLGDVTTLGYNLYLEAGVRLNLAQGEFPFATQALLPAQVKMGEDAYAEAGRLLGSHPDDILSFQVALRTAHVQRMKGDIAGSIISYKQAADLATKTGFPVQAARCQCLAAILAGNRDLYQQGMDALQQANDLSGFYSETEAALSWAYRLQYGRGQPDAAEKVGRMARDTLIKYNVVDQGVDLMTYLANLYTFLGQDDAAIESCNTCADSIRRKLDRSVAANPVGSNNDYAAQEQKILWMNLNIVLLCAQGIYEKLSQNEDTPIWQQDSEKNRLEIKSSAESAGLDQTATTILEAGQTALVFRLKVRDLVREFQAGPSFEASYHDLRAQAKAEGVNPSFLLMADRDASARSPAIFKEGQVALTELNPPADLQAVLDRKYTSDLYKRGSDLQLAVSTYLLELNLADDFKCFSQMSEWTKELKAASAKEPLVNRFCDGAVEFYTARTLLAGGKAADATEAAELLTRILEGRAWNMVETPHKLAVLQSLCDAQIAAGNIDGSLTTYLWWRKESDFSQMFRRRLNPSAKWSAEEAKLLSNAATTGSLSDADGDLLRSLMAKSDEANKAELVPPKVSDIQNLLKAQPADTAILVYRWTAAGLDRWFIRNGTSITCAHVDISTADLTQTIETFQTSGVSGMPQWQSSGKELNDLLFKDLGNFEGFNTIAVLAPGILSELPWEVIASSPAAFRARPGAIVKLTSFLPDDDGTSSPDQADAAPGPDNVVVAYGGDLSAGEQEAKEVAALFKVTPLETKDAILQAIPTAKYLHVVCHGVLLGEDPFGSYLKMGDDRLEAWQLFENAPRADLIVLSACDTAVRHRRDLPLETDSLSIAALAESGGSRFIISTLWPIHDAATAQIMQDFYSQLRDPSCSIPQALHRATVDFSTQNQTAPPYYFAGLSLSLRDVSCLAAHAVHN